MDYEILELSRQPIKDCAISGGKAGSPLELHNYLSEHLSQKIT